MSVLGYSLSDQPVLEATVPDYGIFGPRFLDGESRCLPDDPQHVRLVHDEVIVAVDLNLRAGVAGKEHLVVLGEPAVLCSASTRLRMTLSPRGLMFSFAISS